MSSVYLILNETSFRGVSYVTTEVVEATLDLQYALQWIRDLAVEHNLHLDVDADSVVFFDNPGTSIESDEYYIVEMELKNA